MLVPAVKNGSSTVNFARKAPLSLLLPKPTAASEALTPFEIDRKLLFTAPDEFVSRVSALHRSGNQNRKISIVGEICKEMIRVRPSYNEAQATAAKTLQRTLDSFVVANA